MNINSKRYHEATSLNGHKRNTFLDSLDKKLFNKFYNKHKDDFELYRILWSEAYKNKDFLREVAELFKPSNIYKVEYWFISMPHRIRHWLCCGTKESNHMVNKLARYETWDDVKITWWDKIRFKLITGYKFEG